jgi:hypothetical protein
VIALNTIGKAALPITIAIGFYQAIQLSILTWTGLNACPQVARFPICYLVSFGYALMFIFTLSDNVIGKYPKPFFIGWYTVFVIACAGVASEIVIGDVCPISHYSIPLCYISFTLCLAILFFYTQIRQSIKKSEAR